MRGRDRVRGRYPGRGTPGQVMAPRACSVPVVAKYPLYSIFAFGGCVAGGQAPGMLADEVVEQVAARRGLGE